MTLLVVHEDVLAAERIQELLEENGHSCLIARDFEEAEWTLHVARVDAIVVSFDFPDRLALDWLEELCLASPAVARRTLVLSRRVLGPEELRRVQACGAGVLQEPEGGADLRDSLLRRVRQLPPAEGELRPRPRPPGVELQPEESAD
jgi:DNA-binding response OmpR family regulator